MKIFRRISGYLEDKIISDELAYFCSSCKGVMDCNPRWWNYFKIKRHYKIVNA